MNGSSTSRSLVRLALRLLHERGHASSSACSKQHMVYTERLADAIEQLDQASIQVDREELIYLIKQCSSERALSEGRKLFSHIDRSRYGNDRYMLNLLVDMYGKCGSVDDARSVFERIPQKNEFSWTLIMKACAHNGHFEEVVAFFRRMLVDGLDPGNYICSIVLGACCSLEAPAEGKAVEIVAFDSGFESDAFVGAGLVHMYNKCGRLNDARAAFDRLVEKDYFVWTAMIGAYAQNGHNMEAIQLFRSMDLEGVQADYVTFVSVIAAYASLGNLQQCRAVHACVVQAGLESHHLVETALVNMYGKCGSVEDALSVFDVMHHRDGIAWSAIVAACAQHGHGREALHLFRRMELEGMKPDSVTLASVLNACASFEGEAEGKAIHDRVVAGGYKQDNVLKAAILNMYAKCGSVEGARFVFNRMHSPDVVTWNSLVAAYAQNGHDLEALELFRSMQVEGVMPTIVTFVSVVAACSHAGLLREGRQQFHSMVEDFGIYPVAECYGCMVDLLGRAGQLEDGESLMNTMPFEPHDVGWTSLLGSCSVHGDCDRGARMAERVSELDPENPSPYVLVANMYASAGRWDDLAKMKHKLKLKLKLDDGHVGQA